MTSTPAIAKLLADARADGARGAWGEVRALLGARGPEVRAHPELVTLLGEALLRTHAPREASEFLAETGTMVRRSGDRAASRKAINLEGAACFECGELDRAAERFHEALELGREDGDDLLFARATNNLGAIANLRGVPREALTLYHLAIPAYQRLGNVRGLAETYHNLAISFRDLGDARRTDECERRTLEFARQASDPHLAAMALVGLAELRLRTGDAVLASAEARRAVEEMSRIGDAKGEADALRLAGAAATAIGAYTEAESSLGRALLLSRERGFALIEAESLRVIAELAFVQADRARASTAASAALTIFDELGASAEAQALREWLAAGGLRG
jgi:tetratricopeptide (TPR) repeat protein